MAVNFHTTTRSYQRKKKPTSKSKLEETGKKKHKGRRKSSEKMTLKKDGVV